MAKREKSSGKDYGICKVASRFMPCAGGGAGEAEANVATGIRFRAHNRLSRQLNDKMNTTKRKKELNARTEGTDRQRRRSARSMVIQNWRWVFGQAQLLS